MYKHLVLGAGLLFASTALAAPVPQTKVASNGGYIVVLKDTVKNFESHIEWARSVHKRNLAKRDLDERTYSGIDFTYTGNNHFNGYAGHFDPDTVEEFRNSGDVDSMEEDQDWTIGTIDVPESEADEEEEEEELETRDITEQKNATWGLRSISHRQPGGDNYIYDENAGADTYAYVIDSGIRITHEEFEGRAEQAWTAYGDDHEDKIGHGTHCAATIGGKNYGVTKKTKLIGVKVFDQNSTTTSIIIEGIAWAFDDIIAKNRVGKAVLSMSLGGTYSPTMNRILKNAARHGIIPVAAAGNDAQDISKGSPSSAEGVITVGAIDSDWTVYEKSNFGKNLSLYAPGVMIESAGHTNDTSIVKKTGTSMACPHVAGLALYAMTVDGITGTDNVKKHLLKNATPDKIYGDLNGSPNLIANNGNSQQE
ncbi:hypothetical protein V2G26_005958 [Clonostachys chloroleuca]|uniref:Uncharacterized protein n=1 Tax=Clonostachys chloroleuca TaxID=1926264 RepID=A0AA35M518_9HYPO|nr:unnamed protein product [Clonostachys chloroleuca]